MELKRPGIGAVDAPLDQFQLTGLDRLLWIHLRLLYTQYALSQFLKKTSGEQIQQGIDKLEQQIKQLPPDEDDADRAAVPRGPGRQPANQPRPAGEPEQGPRELSTLRRWKSTAWRTRSAP